MKRANIYLPMATLILAALAIPAAAQKQVPFKGVFKGNDEQFKETYFGGRQTIVSRFRGANFLEQ